MKRKREIVLLILSTFYAAIMVFAQEIQMPNVPSVPNDPDVRIGKLDNGLTYYVRYNNWPEKRAEFYIVQKVGSLQEDEDQRGLAHFLEHMCFNGTKNFPGDSMLRWCESVGIKFGTDINAYTTIDETVYNISNVPTESIAVVDSCMLILKDWADGLALDPKEIDKERGVIHEEWRLRTSATMRMLERNLEALYPGSKYGRRMPIGLMSVVDNFEPSSLRAYYEKWYRPDNQGIIIVGDVDLDYVEGKIKEMFSSIQMPIESTPLIAEQVPDNDEPIIVVDKDKEQRVNMAELMFKFDAIPDYEKNSVMYIVQKYVENAAVGMLNNRLAEISQDTECPFVSGQADYGSYIFSKTKDAFDITALPKEGQNVETAIAAVYREAMRAARFGFVPTEYSRYQADALSSLDKAYSNKEKRYNSQFIREYKDHFLDNEPIPSIDWYYNFMKQMIPMIPIDAVNSVMRAYVPENDSNMVVINFNIEKEGVEYPTKESFLSAIDSVRSETLDAYVDEVKDEPLVSNLPPKGNVIREEVNEKFGYKELLLSNGATVILKHTDLKKDQVILSGEGYGGESLYDAPDYINLKVFDDVIGASGLGNFSNTELTKALAGKIAGASLGISEKRVNVEGTSTPTDVETMLQLIYLYFTDINKDEESFGNLLKLYETSLKNKAMVPNAAFGDSINVTMNCHNPRYNSLTVYDLSQIDYDRILAIAKEITANAAAFTFTIIGNYDEQAIIPLVEQYLASLPSTGDIIRGKDVETLFRGNVVNRFMRKMETPKANAVVVWNNYDCPYTLENRVKVDMAGQILNMIYLKKIREEASAAYSCGAYGSISPLDDRVTTGIMVYCPVKPEKCDTAFTIINSEIEAMTHSCDEDMLTKVKEYLLKAYDDNIKTNDYWLNVIDKWRNYGVDIDTDYRETVKNQTTETVSAFVNQVVGAGNRLEVVMLPDLSSEIK